jgi:hypothetical protein
MNTILENLPVNEARPQGRLVRTKWARNALAFLIVSGPGLIEMEADNGSILLDGAACLPGLAAIGTLGVLAANLLLRPLARRINGTPIEASEHEIYYRFRCTCRSADEAHMRALLLQNVQPTPLALIALHSKDVEGLDRIEVTAQLKSLGRKDAFLEQIVTRLSLEAGVSAISWELVAAVDTEDASVGSDKLVRAKIA